MTPQGLVAPPGKEYYLRPDMGLCLIGFAFYRCLNQKKISYQAGLLQRGWQKSQLVQFCTEVKYIMAPLMVTEA